MLRYALLVLMVVAPMAASPAQDAAKIELRGNVVTATSLTMESLSKLPRVEEEITFQTSKGEEKGRYAGVLLWDLLQENGLKKKLRAKKCSNMTSPLPAATATKFCSPSARSRRTSATSRSCWRMNATGKSLLPADGFRVVVPGDKRGARAVKDVVGIDLQ